MTFLDIAPAVTAIVALLVAVAGYVRFALLRANVGAVFDLEFAPLGRIDGTPVGDLSCLVTNLSSNLLVVTSIRVRIRYTTIDDRLVLRDGLEPTMRATVGPGGREARAEWISIHPPPGADEGSRTVVFQGGTQAYRKPFAFPDGSGLVTVWASCDYRVHVGRLTHWLVRGVLNPPDDLDFTRGVRNHQIRRTFRIEG